MRGYFHFGNSHFLTKGTKKMSEKEILYQNGSHWVCKHKDYYLILKDDITHATEITRTYLDLTHAIEMCDYFKNRILQKEPKK